MSVDSVWNKNYLNGRFNKYPFDRVVSFFFRTYGVAVDHSEVKVLDFGCGGGTHAGFLNAEGFDYWGIDGSDEAVRLTRSVLGTTDADKKVMTADFFSLPFHESFFDVILDRQSLGHNSFENICSITQEIRRVLKPQGKYYGHVFSDSHPDLKFGENLGNGDYRNFTDGAFQKSGLVHVFSPENVKECFVGFDVETATRITDSDVYDGTLINDFFELVLVKS